MLTGDTVSSASQGIPLDKLATIPDPLVRAETKPHAMQERLRSPAGDPKPSVDIQGGKVTTAKVILPSYPV